jgi:hypothetical protein
VAYIEAVTRKLESFPLIGTEKYKPGVRMLPITRYPYLLFYSVDW